MMQSRYGSGKPSESCHSPQVQHAEALAWVIGSFESVVCHFWCLR
jgi:hypothetical protein